MSLSNFSQSATSMGAKALILSLFIAMAVSIAIFPQETNACSDGDCGGWDFGDVSYDGSSGGGWDFGDVSYDGSSGGGWDFGDVSYDGSSGGGWDFGGVEYDGSSGYCCDSGFAGDYCCDAGEYSNDGYYSDGYYDGGYYDSGSYGGYNTPHYSSGSSYYPSSGWSSPAPRSMGGGHSYSTPVTVSSGHSYAQPHTYVQPAPVVTQAAPIHNTNNNNNTNNNHNVNNINVSATAIAIAPAPVAAPVAMYIPPAPVHPAPYCTISIVNHYGAGYGYGQQTLTWNSTNAHSASISPMVGGVTANGSRVITNTFGQVYTMTVWGPGGSATCQTQPMYVPPVPVPTPTAPYVSLSQIPYTGFDFGPVGNAMYWMSLISLALGGAYFLLYFKGGALAFAGSMMSGRENAARQARLAEFTPLPESAFAPAKVASKVSAPVARVGTLDSMAFARSASGAPKIVINRA